MINVDEAAQPLPGDNPAGEDCEYDPLYMTMDSLAAVPADDSDDTPARTSAWQKLNDTCRTLWTRTRDFRVAAYWTAAETMTNGLAGLASGLHLVLFLARDMWEQAYPLLDHDDDDDPLERLNILTMLSPAPGQINDPVMFINRMRELRLASGLPYTVRQLLIARSELAGAADASAPDEALIRAELATANDNILAAQESACNDALETLAALTNEMNDKMKGGYSLSMDSLEKELRRLATFYSALRAEPAPPVAPSPAATAPAEAAGAKSPATPAPVFNLAAYRVGSRSEALLFLKKGAEYFALAEPNSPVPLIVERALRFAHMSFMDLLQDIAPEAVARGKDILGVRDEEQSSD
jgi:type VI secretion system protein ImpA